jgi:hypothetical protein
MNVDIIFSIELVSVGEHKVIKTLIEFLVEHR